MPTEDAISAARADGFSRGHAEGVRAAADEGRREGISRALAVLRDATAELEAEAYGEAASNVFELRRS